MYRWQVKPKDFGATLEPYLLLGNRPPVQSEVIPEEHYTECGPRLLFGSDVSGGPIHAVTCDCLVIGRYGILINKAGRKLSVNEIAVYGAPLTQFPHLMHLK